MASVEQHNRSIPPDGKCTMTNTQRVCKIVITLGVIVVLIGLGLYFLVGKNTQPKNDNSSYVNTYSSDSIAEPDKSKVYNYKKIVSPKEFAQVLKPLLDETRAKQKRVKEELDSNSNIEHCDIVFRENRFADLLDIDGLQMFYIYGCLYEFIDSMTYVDSLDYPVELSSAAELLQGAGYKLFFYGAGEMVSRIEVDAKAEYDFYEKNISNSNRQVLKNLVLEQATGLIVFDAWVSLPLDSLAQRLDRWGRAMQSFNNGETYKNLAYEYVKLYTRLLFFCDLDNSLTFSRETQMINSDVESRLLKIQTQIPSSKVELKKIFQKYFELLKSGKKSYSSSDEETLNIYIKNLYN